MTREVHVTLSKDVFVVGTEERREEEPTQHGGKVRAVLVTKVGNDIILKRHVDET